MKVHFTKAVVATLPVGVHQDAKCAGLVCNVTENSRRYGVYISVRNVPTRKAIGPSSEWSVEAARLKAAELIRELRATPKEKASTVTVGQLADIFTAHLEASGRKTAYYVDDAMRLNWAAIKDRHIDSITVMELAEAHNKIVKERGPSAAHRAITTLRTMYHYASSLELTEKNPAKKVRLVPEKSRDVFLDGGQVLTLRRALKTMLPQAEAFFLLSLLTGLRRSNICGMRWEWCDLDQGICTVPASESKNGERIEAVLVPEAVEILRARQGLSDTFVFPSAKASCGHLVEPWFWVVELREKMAELGCDVPWTIHDLRRSFAVALTAAGAPLTVVAKALSHRNIDTTPIYARASNDTVRDFLSRVA